MNSITLRAGQTSQPIPLDLGALATLSPASTGTGYIETTQSSLTDINNGVATWTTWPQGTVSATASNTARNSMFCRLVCLTGNMNLTTGDGVPFAAWSNSTSPWKSQTVQFAASGAALVGDGTELPNLTNPQFGAVFSANNYIQNYIWNKSTGVNASADFIAYPDNGLDTSGWVDMGITSSGFTQAAYAVTAANEGYLFMSAPSGAGKTGNLVIATDSTGTANKIQLATGGFTTKTNVRVEIDSTGLAVITAGAGLKVKEGSNCKQGTAVLVGGTVTVANTSVTANSRIMLTSQVDGGAPGFLRISARVAATSFTITSSSGTDTSTVAYQIFEPG